MVRRYRLPHEIPLEEYPAPSIFVKEATACVEDAEKKGIPLRIMGGLACYIHSRKYEELWKALGRLGKRVFTDIDFMSYGKFNSEILEFFTKRDYITDPMLMWRYGKKRLIFFANTTGKVPMIEVFLDELDMNHKISFKGRLEADTPTIPLAELLLEKLQIVKINEKDIKDCIILLRAHDIGESDKDIINLGRVSKLLLSDWGFYYTATTNLRKIKDNLKKYTVLTDEDKEIISQRIEKIQKWYKDVADWMII